MQPVEQKEDSLGGLIGAFAVIGGYIGALVGVFTPPIVTIVTAFMWGEGIIEQLFYLVVFLAIGAIVWIPASIILGIMMGLGGLGIGLGTGIISAVLYHVTRGNPSARTGVKIVTALLNAIAFGYAAFWLYSTDGFQTYVNFVDLENLPQIAAGLGAIFGFLLGFMDPASSSSEEGLSEAESEEAMRALGAPFRAWKRMAGMSANNAADMTKAVADDLQRKP